MNKTQEKVIPLISFSLADKNPESQTFFKFVREFSFYGGYSRWRRSERTPLPLPLSSTFPLSDLPSFPWSLRRQRVRAAYLLPLFCPSRQNCRRGFSVCLSEICRLDFPFLSSFRVRQVAERR